MPEKSEKPETPRDAASSPAKPKKRDRAADALAAREAALDRAALQFKALGDPTRLRIARLVAEDTMPSRASDDVTSADDAARDGWTVGDVSARLFGKSKISSTLSHHLKELRHAQLITMKRRGKNLICRVQEREIAGLRCYLAIRPDARAAQTPTGSKQPLREGESRLDPLGDRNDTPAV